MGDVIDNPKSSRVKRVAALARKKDRRESERFLVEGPQAVRELLSHRPELADEIFATTDTAPWHREIERLADAAQVRIEPVTPQVLSAMAETVNPQGVVAVARTWHTPLSEAVAGARLIAILHEVRDPGNAGTVLRAADAAGAHAVIFSGDSVDPFHPKVVRSTTGSLFHLPVAFGAGLDEVVAAAITEGMTTVAADVGGTDLMQARSEGLLEQRIAWVFGNEARGLTETQRQTIGRSVRLPIYGAAESLNLATAASVLLYETAFAHRVGGEPHGVSHAPRAAPTA